MEKIMDLVKHIEDELDFPAKDHAGNILHKFLCTIGKSSLVFSFECECCYQGSSDPYRGYCLYCGGHVAPKHVGSLRQGKLGNGQQKELEVNGTRQLVYI